MHARERRRRLHHIHARDRFVAVQEGVAEPSSEGLLEVAEANGCVGLLAHIIDRALPASHGEVDVDVLQGLRHPIEEVHVLAREVRRALALPCACTVLALATWV